MANNLVAPTREEMDVLGFSHRVQAYLEDIDKFSIESNIESDSILNLLAAANGLIGVLLSELYELKKRIDDLENEVN